MGCTLINHHEDLIESQIPINSRILLTSLSRFAKSLIVLLKYLIFGGKSPEVGPKNPFCWMNPRVLKPLRLSFALSAWQRCSAVAGAATTTGGPWSTSLIRFTEVYKKMPLKSLNTWYLSIFSNFDLSQSIHGTFRICQTWVPQIHWLIILFPDGPNL